MLTLKNLFITRDAFKVGILPTGEILKSETEAPSGTLLVSGNARKTSVKMQLSQVVGHQLVPISTFSKEQQIDLLGVAKEGILAARLSVIFLYEIAWQRSSARGELKAQHRLKTLPHEITSRQLKHHSHGMNQLGARAIMA